MLIVVLFTETRMHVFIYECMHVSIYECKYCWYVVYEIAGVGLMKCSFRFGVVDTC